MKSDIQDYAKRSERHGNIDGLLELDLGIGQLVFALTLYVFAIMPKDSWLLSGWHSIFLLGFVWGLVACVSYWGQRAIRRHITYPRSGYVKPWMDTIPWMGFLLTGLLLVAIFAVGTRHDRVSLALLMMTVPLSYAYGVARLDRRKWPVLVVQVLGLLVISLVPASVFRSLVLATVGSRSLWPVRVMDIFGYIVVSLVFFSLTLLASSGITLYLYIRLDRRKWPVLVVLVLNLLVISLVPASDFRSLVLATVGSRSLWPVRVMDIFGYIVVSMVFFSLTLLVSGGITLYLYIRRTRPRAGDGE